MTINDRLIKMARTLAEACQIRLNVIKNDPIEAPRANFYRESIERLNKKADLWEGKPMFIGFDPAAGKDLVSIVQVDLSVTPPVFTHVPLLTK